MIAHPNGDESLTAAIVRVRSEVMEAQAALRAVESAAVPRSETKAQLAAMVQKLAERGKPKLREGIDFCDPQAFASTAERIGELLAWFDPDRMTARLCADLDATPEPKGALTAQQKWEKSAELTGRIAKLERQEVALVERAQADNADVLHRSTISPLALLGIVRQTKAKAK